MAVRNRVLVWNVYTATTVVSGLATAIHIALRGPDPWALVTFMVAALLTDLVFTLVERRRRGKMDSGPAPAIVRNPRLIKLALAEAHLAALLLAYKTGRTSGHPEDTLWDIEDAEKRVANLRAGTD